MPCIPTTLPDGTHAIICTGGRRKRCACDRPICTRCTLSPAPEKDLCPDHAQAFHTWKAARDRQLQPRTHSMSSFLRRIQRTTKKVRTKDGDSTVQRRPYFNGRGAKLGTKNPRDPCTNPKFRKKPRPWRSKRALAAEPGTPRPQQRAKCKLPPRAPSATRADRREQHHNKLAKKRTRRLSARNPSR